MQQSDDVIDGAATRGYTDSAIVKERSPAYSLPRRTAAVLSAWLIPGAGHLILGRYVRGIIFLVTIIGCFFLGLGLNGRLFWPVVPETPTFLHFDLISLLWTFAQFGSGLCYLGSFALGIGVSPHPEATTYEYGNTFMLLAGLLNYLVIHDSFDIAAGRKK